MQQFEGRHLADFYPDAVRKVQSEGSLVVPRFKPCWEIRPAVFTTHEWHGKALPGVNYRFAYAEFMAIICGWDDVDWLQRFVKTIAQFSDDGSTFYGAYGPRMYKQLGQALYLLEMDPDSRQAVVGIWEARDLPAETKDIPCNTHFYLKVRRNALHMTVLRRSADIVWGVPVDNFVFGHILHYLAQFLELETGALVEFIDSLHLYTPEAGYCTAARVEKALEDPRPLNTPLFTCRSLDTLRRTFTLARRAVVSGSRVTGNAEEVRKFLCD